MNVKYCYGDIIISCKIEKKLVLLKDCLNCQHYISHNLGNLYSNDDSEIPYFAMVECSSIDYPKATFVYFILDEISDSIKIGYSTNPENRLNALQTGCPHKLKLLFKYKCDKSMEKEFHNGFSTYKKSGEWFEYADEIKSWIETMGGAVCDDEK